MKKIVVNQDFGGFSLSHEGMMRYHELKGIPLYVYSEVYNKKGIRRNHPKDGCHSDDRRSGK